MFPNLPKNRTGKFIVLYGANNTGKSTQVKSISNKLSMLDQDFLKLKYPLYRLNSTGPRLHKILREELEIKEVDLQKIFAQNRLDFQETLVNNLKAGINIVAEDYYGTSLAWGITNTWREDKEVFDYETALKQFMDLNDGIYKPDLSLFLDGKRFSSRIEPKHRNENSTTQVWEFNRDVHLKLGKKFGWKKINATQEIEKVTKDLWKEIKPILNAT